MSDIVYINNYVDIYILPNLLHGSKVITSYIHLLTAAMPVLQYFTLYARYLTVSVL